MFVRLFTVSFTTLVGYAVLMLGCWNAGQAPPPLWEHPWFWGLFAIAVLTPSRWWLWSDLNPFDDFPGCDPDGGD